MTTPEYQWSKFLSHSLGRAAVPTVIGPSGIVVRGMEGRPTASKVSPPTSRSLEENIHTLRLLKIDIIPYHRSTDPSENLVPP